MTYKRYALLLGINEYRDPEIQPLTAAKADALAMYVFVLSKLGFDRAQLVEAEQAHQFLDLVEAWSAELGPNDLLVVYYAGHGYEVNHKHFLLTPADRLSRLKADLGTLHKEALVHAMRGHGCHRVLITDSCRSALVGSRGGPQPQGHTAIDRDLGLKEAKETQGSLTLFNACDEGKTAAELKQAGSGLFTQSLLRVWGETLAQGGSVTVDTALQQKVAEKMRETAAHFGLDGDQYPWLLSSGWLPALSVGGVQNPSSPAQANPHPTVTPKPSSPPPPRPVNPPPALKFPALNSAWKTTDELLQPGGRPVRFLAGMILLLLVLNWLFHGRTRMVWTPWPHRIEERGRR